MLGLVLLGTMGLAAELILLEHYGSIVRSLPFGVLVLTLGTSVGIARHPRRWTVRAFQAVMWIMLLTGVVGVWLHYDDNAAFEREIDPDLGGFRLAWIALRGATPILAPGALVQLALLGLILVHRHSTLLSEATTQEEGVS